MKTKTKTTATNDEATPVLMPKLRFPEFRGAEGWKPSVLADACDMQAGKFVSASNISERNQSGLFPCYGGNGLRGYTTTHTHDGTYPLIGRQGALCGNVRLASGQFHATEHAVVATPKKTIEVVWLCYSLDLLNLNRFATGQAQPGLSVDVLENVALAIPPLESEQQKIAECLSSVDKLMAAQAQKVDALKTHKKGLMQQLFPREGETQPRLRFPEFQNAGAWEESQLDQLTIKISDGIHTTPNYEENGEYAFINGNNLVNGRILIDEKTKRVNANEFKKHRKPLDDNSILMSINGTIGNLAFYQNEDVILGKSACFINVDIGSVDRIFIYNLLQTDKVQSVFNAELTGSTIKNLSLGAIKNVVISVPRLPEQQRIASCLSSLDALITAETQKHEALKIHKKGLMQQLFPAPTEQAHTSEGQRPGLFPSPEEVAA